MIEDYETSAERELSVELDEVRAERDRLRAVVDAARMVVAGIEFANPGGVTEPIPINRLADLKAALSQLDVSPTMGGEVAPGDRDDSLLAAIRADRRQTSEGDDDLTVAVDPSDQRGAGAATSGAPSETSTIGQRTSCSTCGTPYRWQRKWNSGNPKEFLLSDCACEPEAVDPTSPTYDPDQYGTFTQADGATNSPLGGTDMAAILETLDATHPDREHPFHEWLGRKLEAGDAGDEQPSADVQEGGLPGSAVAAEEVVAGDAPADKGGAGEGGDAGAGTAPARGEVGPGVGGGEWMDL